MSSLSGADGGGFDGVRGEQGVEGWFVSLDEAQSYVVGNEAWWNNTKVKSVVSIPPSTTEKPMWMYSNGDMYLGQWEYCHERQRFVENGVGATYIHNPSKFRGVIYVGGWKKGDFSGSAQAFWLESSPTWIRNELCDTGVRQAETSDGKLVGRPYSYTGTYKDNVESDARAIVTLKDGTTRIGPWAEGKPVGDWWKDHESVADAASTPPPQPATTTNSRVTEHRAPTITPPKKRKHISVKTSRERKRGVFEADTARTCRDSAHQKSLQETTEQNDEASTQDVETMTLKQEDEEYVFVDTDQDCEEEITMWLVTVIGYSPSKELMSQYAKQFMNLGLHSSQMISDLLPASRVSTFEWMREFHRVQFLSNANLKC